MLLRPLVGLLALALAACATTYGPARIGKVGGYEETQVGPTSFAIRAAANGPADRFAPVMALYRAAELTLANNYSHFLVLQASGTETLVGYGTPTGFAGDEANLTIRFQNDETIPEFVTGQRVVVMNAAETIARLQPEIDKRQ